MTTVWHPRAVSEVKKGMHPGRRGAHSVPCAAPFSPGMEERDRQALPRAAGICGSVAGKPESSMEGLQLLDYSWVPALNGS